LAKLRNITNFEAGFESRQGGPPAKTALLRITRPSKIENATRPAIFPVTLLLDPVM